MWPRYSFTANFLFPRRLHFQPQWGFYTSDHDKTIVAPLREREREITGQTIFQLCQMWKWGEMLAGKTESGLQICKGSLYLSGQKRKTRTIQRSQKKQRPCLPQLNCPPNIKMTSHWALLVRQVNTPVLTNPAHSSSCCKWCLKSSMNSFVNWIPCPFREHLGLKPRVRICFNMPLVPGFSNTLLEVGDNL